MQYSQEHLKTMVYAKFGGQTECVMGNSKIENKNDRDQVLWARETEHPKQTLVFTKTAGRYNLVEDIVI